MKSQGIRISDKKNGTGLIDFVDILAEINNGNSFYWSILFLEVIGNLGEERLNPPFAENINKSVNGLFMDWEGLNSIAKKFEQVIDMIVLGCKDKNKLQRYEIEQEMYETCDIVIQMVDSSFWEVFSIDVQLIERLEKKFKQIKFLESDFLEKQR